MAICTKLNTGTFAHFVSAYFGTNILDEQCFRSLWEEQTDGDETFGELIGIAGGISKNVVKTYEWMLGVGNMRPVQLTQCMEGDDIAIQVDYKDAWIYDEFHGKWVLDKECEWDLEFFIGTESDFADFCKRLGYLPGIAA